MGHGTFFLLTPKEQPSNRQDGCPQVCRGASEEEAVGCDAVPPPCPLLGAPPVERHPPRFASLAPRQGPPSRLQGQAGLRYLPRACPPWWPQEAAPKGATYGKPTNQGINQLKYQRSLRPPPRSVSAAAAPTCASSTRTGLTRTPPTSTTRSSSSTPSTRPSVSIPASTGSSTPSTSTARPVVSPPPARSPAVSTRATATTTPRPVAARPGSARTPSPCGATDKRNAVVSVLRQVACQWIGELSALVTTVVFGSGIMINGLVFAGFGLGRAGCCVT